MAESEVPERPNASSAAHDRKHANAGSTVEERPFRASPERSRSGRVRGENLSSFSPRRPWREES